MNNDEGKQAGHRTILVDTDALSTVQDALTLMWTSAGKVNSVLHWIFTTAIYIYIFLFSFPFPLYQKLKNTGNRLFPLVFVCPGEAASFKPNN